MISRTVPPARAPLLNTLLGVVLVLVAGLDIVMAGGIAWAGWQRAPQITPPATVPSRCFVVRSRGSTAALLSFLALVARISPPTSRLEAVSLQQDGESAELSFLFRIFVRPPDDTSAGAPVDSQAVTLP